MTEPFFVMCACGHGQQEEIEDKTHFGWKCEGCFRTNSFREVEVAHKKPKLNHGGVAIRQRLGEEGRARIDHQYQGNAQDRYGWE